MKEDLNDKFGGIIIGAAVLSGLMSGNIGVGVIVGVGLGAMAVYSGLIRL